uniref:HECT domain E3 ubiquitin protein ligase 2 n=1 Tax=Fundulus heteroclitus TaxID=8078 RepID=A0A3Q2QK97_FUNHE
DFPRREKTRFPLFQDGWRTFCSVWGGEGTREASADLHQLHSCCFGTRTQAAVSVSGNLHLLPKPEEGRRRAGLGCWHRGHHDRLGGVQAHQGAASHLQRRASEAAVLHRHAAPRGQSSFPLRPRHPAAHQDQQGVPVSLRSVINLSVINLSVINLSVINHSVINHRVIITTHLPAHLPAHLSAREDVDRAVQSGDWREVRDFYLTTFDSFIEINAAFKREANGLFNTIEDSGVNGKFVNAVYDSLLSTVSV